MSSALLAMKLFALWVPLVSADGHACKCKFQQAGEIPAAAAAKAGNKHYGSDCSTKWDMIEGTTYYKNDTVCPDKCVKGCNYLNLEWCYVERGCEGATYFNTTLEGAGDLAYSYDVCGNPYCWNDFGAWGEGCPGSHMCQAEPDKCSCKFEAAGRIPVAASEKAGSTTYGVSCASKHDSVPGTVYYKDDTTCPDKCVKGCNFLNLEWCYVERGCSDKKHFNTTLEGAGDLAYSYEMCGNPYCWNDFGGWDEGCPGGDECAATSAPTPTPTPTPTPDSSDNSTATPTPTPTPQSVADTGIYPTLAFPVVGAAVLGLCQ